MPFKQIYPNFWYCYYHPLIISTFTFSQLPQLGFFSILLLLLIWLRELQHIKDAMYSSASFFFFLKFIILIILSTSLCSALLGLEYFVNKKVFTFVEPTICLQNKSKVLQIMAQKIGRSRFPSTSLKAANLVRVSKTVGIGRQAIDDDVEYLLYHFISVWWNKKRKCHNINFVYAESNANLSRFRQIMAWIAFQSCSFRMCKTRVPWKLHECIL